MSDYTDLLIRVRAGLMDTSAAVWQSPELDEALRQALADMSLSAGAAYTITGLDGALITSLPAQYFATLVRGAAAYAVLWRAIERLDAFSLRPNLPSAAAAVAAGLLARFEMALSYLAALRTAEMQTAVVSPYPTGIEPTQPGWTLPHDLSSGGG